jgi:hypothetical protein
MLTNTVKIELPGTLLDRARVDAMDDARELVTFLLERYVQELEKVQRWQAYEAYYETRTLQDEAEEREIMADFAYADAESDDGFSA